MILETVLESDLLEETPYRALGLKLYQDVDVARWGEIISEDR